MGWIGQSLNHFVAVANVLCHCVIETRLVRVHLERHSMRLPAAKDLVALRVRDVFLWRTNDKVSELLSLAREQSQIIQAAEVHVVVEQKEQVLKAAVVLFTLVRCRCQ